MDITSQTIEKLIDFTKKEDLGWYYLSENEELSEKSLVATTFVGFNDISSFYAKSGSGYFVLIENINYSELILIVFPTIDSKDIKCLNTDTTYQQELLRLQNLVKKQFPNVEDFLDNFLAK